MKPSLQRFIQFECATINKSRFQPDFNLARALNFTYPKNQKKNKNFSFTFLARFTRTLDPWFLLIFYLKFCFIYDSLVFFSFSLPVYSFLAQRCYQLPRQIARSDVHVPNILKYSLSFRFMNETS